VHDLFPANGASELLHGLVAYPLTELTPIISTAILVDSRIADVVEQSQRCAGRAHGLSLVS
jgi:hypothetical protein